jgi:O-antigen/teichoic acid export membrane protein
MSKISLSYLLQHKNVHSLANNGVIAVFGLVNFLILTKSLSQKEVGQWAIFLAGTTLLERVRSGLMQSALINYSVGTEKDVQKTYYAAAWWLGFIITLLMIILIEICSFFLFHSADFVSFKVFFSFFSITYLVTFPAYHAYWQKITEQKFLHLLLLRIITFGFFFLFLVAHYFYFHLPVEKIGWGYITGHTLSSLLALVLGWCDWRFWKSVPIKKMKELFNFGKYSLGSQLSEHLLKSIDSFMLGYFLSPVAVAIYQVPNKIVEGFEILIRSFGINLHNQLSLLFKNNKIDDFRKVLYQYIRNLTLFFLLIALFLIPLSTWIVVWLGGDEYESSASVLRIFMIFYLFMPFFKFVDVGLDASWKPNIIYIKTSIMLIINIVGNFIAIHFFQSIEGVAMVSVLVYGLGAVAGWVMLGKVMPLFIGKLIKD